MEKVQKILLGILLATITISFNANAEWYFRGTTNNWSTTELQATSTQHEFSICQAFNAGQRFKIDRWGNWQESYPSSDYIINESGSYLITFNEHTRVITVTKVADCNSQTASWYFRGTPNGWGKNQLTRIGDSSKYEITVTFNGEETPARFKIDSGNWTESYPQSDYQVDDFKTYKITFDTANKANIEVVERVVDPVLQSISVTPSSLNLIEDSSQPLTVTASYDNGTTKNVTANASYASANENIATVSSSGSVTAVTPGSTTITATFGTKQDSTTVNVAAKPEDLVIRLKAPDNWEQANIHYWNAVPAGAAEDTQWPGKPMNKSGDLYEIRIPGIESLEIVFNDGNGQQTDDLSREGNGCYDVVADSWSENCDTGPVAPEVHATPASLTFNTDTTDITLSLDGEQIDAARYTLDGSDPKIAGTDFENGDVITIGENVPFDSQIELNIYANNSAGGDLETFHYNKQSLTTGFTVILSAPTDWNATIHHWNALPEGSENDSVWPGDSMIKLADGWFRFEFKQSSSSELIFSNSGSDKTENLERDRDGCYFIATQSWTDSCDIPKQDADVDAEPGARQYTSDTLDITLRATGDDVTGGQYTLDGSDPSLGGEDFSDGDVITIGEGEPVDTITTVCLYAENTDSQANECFDYRKIEKPAGSQFSWDNATVYFVMTDRFVNGDTSNDNSYGRERDRNGNIFREDDREEGTFHGGDLVGLTSKLNEGYFEDLGVNAIWITSPLEQVHGYVAGRNFKHYGYHGYYHLDWSEIDQNMGDEDALKTFIDTAHSKGIRVIFDVVINHTGYDSLYDMGKFNYGTHNGDWENYYFTSDNSFIIWGENEGQYHFYLKRDNAFDWSKWWGADWVRAGGTAGYEDCPSSAGDLKMCSGFLPDLKTESNNEVGLPPLLLTKWDDAKEARETQELDDFFSRTGKRRTVSNHMIKWLTDWVREYGVDGFRMDTAKHVDLFVFKDLKEEASNALREWRANNPNSWPDGQELDFWMTGEVYGHGVSKNSYYDNGFDSLINFSFQGRAGDLSNIDNVYSEYANAVNNDPDFNILSYISSHDKQLGHRGNLVNAGTALMLLPGGVQIFYGDETARQPAAGWTGGDDGQASRSDMNWDSVNQEVLSHWQKLGQFRNAHVAVGAGSHTRLSSNPYAFSRVKGDDKVIVMIGASGTQSIDVNGLWPDGTVLTESYNGNTSTVENGRISFTADSNGILLIGE